MHIPQDEFQKFQDGTMNTDEMIRFLEHMNQCDFCLDELLQNEDAASEYAPSYLQDEILKKAASPEVQASRKIHETAYWMKLLCRLTDCRRYGCCADHAFFCIADRFYGSSSFTPTKLRFLHRRHWFRPESAFQRGRFPAQ